MKQSPDNRRLEEILRSSKIVGQGLLGTDTRRVEEIIEADRATLSNLALTPTQVAFRMQYITNQAIQVLGNWADIDDQRKARVQEAKGRLICPWPHPVYCDKRVTILRRIDLNSEIQWSDLNIHMIGEHGFFEGRGSRFRLEPQGLVSMIFDEK